jgi:hypothetical protein
MFYIIHFMLPEKFVKTLYSIRVSCQFINPNNLVNSVNNGIFDCISRQLRGTRPRLRGMEKKPDNDYESLALPLSHASIYIYLQ